MRSNATDTRTELVGRWLSAFNMRDLAAMLKCLDPEVAVHPLKLHGIASAYYGHAGVADWFERLETLGHDHRIVVSSLRALPDGVVLVAGRISFGGESVETDFCGVTQVSGERIVSVRHYMSDPQTVERLGLVSASA